MLAAFGFPPLAHRDDPQRGLRAALLVEESLREMGTACTVGVTTGRVYCGAVGGDVRREYTVVGGPINLAARLTGEAKAAGRFGYPILVDSTTRPSASSSSEISSNVCWVSFGWRT